MDIEKVYCSERLKALAEVTPRFTAHARKGDALIVGVKDKSWKGTSRKATVTKVVHEGKPTAVIHVEFEDGSTERIPPLSVDPRWVWRFANFDDVLKRTEKREKKGQEEPGSYDELLKLRDQVRSMNSDIEQRRSEDRQWRRAVVDSIAQICEQVNEKQGKGSESFTSILADEWEKMNGSRRTKAKPSPYDSGDDD